MNIFVLEDDTTASYVVSYLTRRGHRVKHAMELYSTIEFLEESPGLQSFDLLLFDIGVPRCEYTRPDGNKAVYDADYPGLEYIIERYTNWPEFRAAVDAGRVAMYTAFAQESRLYIDEARKTHPGLANVKVISKVAYRLPRELLDFIGNGN